VAEAAGFIRSTGTVVAKRNRTYGGKGVSRIWRQGNGWRIQAGAGVTSEHETLETLLEALFAADSESCEFVQYQRNVGAGDKRVLVVEGEIYGAFLRLAGDGGWINNVTSGGTALAATVSPREEEVIRATCDIYRQRGIYTLGYDFLLGESGTWMLSEINAGPNIGGYRLLEHTSGIPVLPRLFDWVLRLASR
jgi:glutathione synthase/RimK-type ligase-like ATP-grasp enzyme